MNNKNILIVSILLILTLFMSGCIGDKKEEIIPVTTSEIRYVYITPTPTITTVISIPEEYIPVVSYSFESPASTYKDGGYPRIIKITNTGNVVIKDMIVTINYYRASGDFFVSRRIEIGDIDVDSFKDGIYVAPTKGLSYESWTNQEINIYYNKNTIDIYKCIDDEFQSKCNKL